MVKILFDSIFDVLAPCSRTALQQLLVSRFDAFAQSHPDCAAELSRFCHEFWRPEEFPELPFGADSKSNESLSQEDRFSLVRAFCTRGASMPKQFKTAQRARFAVYRAASPDFPTPPITPQQSATASSASAMSTSAYEEDGEEEPPVSHLQQQMQVQQQTCGSEDNEADLDRLHLSSDAPIVRCLLGLSQLPDVTLWLLCVEPAAFVAQVLRRLPVAPFFEGVAKLWRLIETDPNDTAQNNSVTQHREFRRRTNALSHETMVKVSESRAEAQAAADAGRCWVGVHLALSQLNRAASVEALHVFDSASSPRSRGDSGRESPAAGNTVGTSSAFAGVSPPGSPARAGGGGVFVTASGIPALGRVIVQRVPELRSALLSAVHSSSASSSLASNGGGGNAAMSPLLLAAKTAPQKQFCICNCFWTGVGAGVAASVTAIAGFGLIWVTTTALLKTFGVKRPQKNP